ncbi:MAG: hypothetical protein IT323_03895, partial [Anaerolineae bacterium]|nr:hypothetical protein [Anaerolineae bacterium]
MKKRAVFTILLIIVVASLLSFSSPAAAQTSPIYWKRWDVAISNVDINANRFHVRETHVLVAAGRSFNGGDRQIPLGRLTGITNIAVAEGGRP